MRCVCLFSGTNKVQMRFGRCQTHPYFLVNSKTSLVFCFLFLSEQKIHIHRAMKMQRARLFWWLWHRSLNKICNQIAKTRPSWFAKTMLEKTGRFVHHRVSAEIFPGDGNIDILLIVFRLLTNGRSWSFTLSIPQKFPMKTALHSHHLKNRIQVEVYMSLPKGCTFCHSLQLLLNWRIIQYRYHCKVQRTESELTWNLHNYVCGSVINRDARAAAGDAEKGLSAMETYKKQKNRYQLCLFLFSDSVDLKNNNKNYRKPFWIFWVRE